MLGAISLSTCSYFRPMAVSKFWKPVMFPPGRAGFITKPRSTGSETTTQMMGIVCLLFARRRVGPDDDDVCREREY